MSNKIQEILSWYSQYDNTDICIKTQNNEFNVNINNRQLPHILGMQYTLPTQQKTRIRGNKLYTRVKNLSDEEIFKQISENHPEQLEHIKDRVENFQTFMKNLDKAILYEMTNPNTKIKSEYLLVKTEDNKFLQMGIAREREYEDYLETFLITKNDFYFSNSKIQESVLSVERYRPDGTLEPFSFSNTAVKAQQNIINPQEVETQNVSASFNLPEKSTEKEQKQIKTFDRQEFNKLIDSIDDIVKNYEQNPELIAEYFAFRLNFYNYSSRNTLLIKHQNPYSTFVAPFVKWKKLGYSVKKGEKAIRILRPIEKLSYVKDGKTLIVNSKTPSSDKAKIASGEYFSTPYTTFAQAMVFDISQTDCPPEDYPTIFSRGTENADRAAIYECVKEYAQLTGFTVTEDNIKSISLGGYYKPSDDTIHINNTLKDDKKLSVLCHELAHGMLHKTSDKPDAVKEFEAESFSTMLQARFGFMPSDANKEYIKQNFLKAKDLINPKETLMRTEKMFKAASSGITEIMKERGLISENSRDIVREEKITPTKAQDIKSNFIQAL